MELATAVLGALVTGILGYLFGWRGFLLKERYEERRAKRDKLRTFLTEMVPEMRSVLYQLADFDSVEWGKLNYYEGEFQWLHGEWEELNDKARELHRKAETVSAYFPNDDIAYNALRRIGNIVGSYNEDLGPLPMFDVVFSEQSRMDIFEEDVEALQEVYKRLDARVTGEGKRRWIW